MGFHVASVHSIPVFVLIRFFRGEGDKLPPGRRNSYQPKLRPLFGQHLPSRERGTGLLRPLPLPFFSNARGVAYHVRSSSLLCHHGVVQSVVGQTVMTVDPRVSKGRVLVAAEGEHGLVHLLGVEDTQAYQ
jgi:hypothetical protein